MRPLRSSLALSGIAAALVAAPAATPARSKPLAQLAGATVMTALFGPPSASLLDEVREGKVGGVILLGHWASAALMRGATSSLQQAACTRDTPLLIAVDQEGGLVRRLPWAAPFDSAGTMGAGGSPAQVQEQGALAAAALERVGVQIDLAPVTDTLLSPAAFLGSRSFGSDPTLVGALAAAFVDGLQHAGVAATAKHFPGLGAARANTDDAAVSVLRVRLGPFQEAIAAGVQLVMVSNASYPKLDTTGTPAVFSYPIVTTLLRGRLGFNGVVVTDALDAPTPARTPHAAARAIRAGVDLLLYSTRSAADRGYASLVQDARADPALRTRLEESGRRLDQLRLWLGLHC